MRCRPLTLCDEARDDDVLVVANENSPVQVVISGSIPAIEREEALAKERRICALRRNVAGAVPLRVDAAGRRTDRGSAQRHRAQVAAVPDRRERRGCAGRRTGAAARSPAATVVSPVRWESCVRALSDAGATVFVEAGPGHVLTKLAKRVVPEAKSVAIGSP